MRKKIKDILNKEEGFTLVELLAVIVILGIIVAIAIPAIGNVTQRAQTDANEAQAELIIDAAQLYAVDEDSYNYPNDIKISDLISKGYLEASKVDAVETDVVAVEEVSSGTYKYTYKDFVRGAEFSNPTE